MNPYDSVPFSPLAIICIWISDVMQTIGLKIELELAIIIIYLVILA